MSAAHTPGPWHFGRNMRGQTRVFANGWEIVRAMSKNGSRVLPIPEREANALLIAAAPDLLAALQGLIREIAPTAVCQDHPAFNAARAAIFKAKRNVK